MPLTEKEIEEARHKAKLAIHLAEERDGDSSYMILSRAVLALLDEREAAERYFSPELDHPASWSMFQNHLRVLEYAKTGGKPCR